MGWNGMSNGADCIQQQGTEVDKGMQGDVMQMRSSCMGPTGLPYQRNLYPSRLPLVRARRGC